EVAVLSDLALRVTRTQLVPAAVDLLSPPATGESATLAVRFEAGGGAAAQGQGAGLREMGGARGAPAGVLQGDAEHLLWEDFAAALAAPAGAASLVLKASVLPMEVPRWLAILEEHTRQMLLTARWRAHVGHGIIYARLSGAEEALVAAVPPLRQAALDSRGSLVVADGPASVLGEGGVWGARAGLACLRRLEGRLAAPGTLY